MSTGFPGESISGVILGRITLNGCVVNALRDWPMTREEQSMTESIIGINNDQGYRLI